MLARDFAKTLIPLVNSEVYELIHDYVKYRKELIQAEFTKAKDMNAVSIIKGQLQELERFVTLREEVLEDVKKHGD